MILGIKSTAQKSSYSESDGRGMVRIGVLIVGSLLWDQRDHRQEWRDARLDLTVSVRCWAPIRYGRESGGRDHTFTMVLSRLVRRKEYGMGVGILVPCREECSNLDELLTEAKYLWAAETSSGDGNRRIGADWGRIGVLFRDRNHPLAQEWGAAARAHGVTVPPCTKSEGPVVDSNGLLRIGWPDRVSGESELPVDVILATATTPTLDRARYPTSREVADRWTEKRVGEEKYFFLNVESGIRTFQDWAIWKRLAASDRALVYERDYPDAVRYLNEKVPHSA